MSWLDWVNGLGCIIAAFNAFMCLREGNRSAAWAWGTAAVLFIGGLL